jgi:hypothetical protein
VIATAQLVLLCGVMQLAFRSCAYTHRLRLSWATVSDGKFQPPSICWRNRKSKKTLPNCIFGTRLTALASQLSKLLQTVQSGERQSSAMIRERALSPLR